MILSGHWFMEMLSSLGQFVGTYSSSHIFPCYAFQPNGRPLLKWEGFGELGENRYWGVLTAPCSQEWNISEILLFPFRDLKSKAETEAESKANAIRWLSWKFLFLISSARETEKEYALNSKNYRDQKYRRKTLGPKSREDKSSEGGWYEVLGTTEVFQIWTQVGIFSWEKTHTYMLSTQF